MINLFSSIRALLDEGRDLAPKGQYELARLRLGQAAALAMEKAIDRYSRGRLSLLPEEPVALHGLAKEIEKAMEDAKRDEAGGGSLGRRELDSMAIWDLLLRELREAFPDVLGGRSG